MTRKLVRTLSFRPEDIDVYKYLGTKANISRYVIGLVKNDMRDNALEKRIRKIVTEELNARNTRPLSLE